LEPHRAATQLRTDSYELTNNIALLQSGLQIGGVGASIKIKQKQI